ncbi:hypothetical protein MMC22_003317 [Lobaria immixta]|nr:hypothetical protein [Lobaria immixta]
MVTRSRARAEKLKLKADRPLSPFRMVTRSIARRQKLQLETDRRESMRGLGLLDDEMFFEEVRIHSGRPWDLWSSWRPAEEYYEQRMQTFELDFSRVGGAPQVWARVGGARRDPYQRVDVMVFSEGRSPNTKRRRVIVKGGEIRRLFRQARVRVLPDDHFWRPRRYRDLARAATQAAAQAAAQVFQQASPG